LRVRFLSRKKKNKNEIEIKPDLDLEDEIIYHLTPDIFKKRKK
jgi:hypothetical protein